ncbi:MAG: hypothetical protein FJW31_16115 [Acidobacteria bacterium]|nr:hypothetical protein [Acidobacteriota bacterium]
MDLLQLFQWFEATAIGTAVRESLWMFPAIQCGHLLTLALLGGAVLVVDLRMLGLGLTAQPINELAAKVHPWMVAAWAGIIVTGIPMFLSEAVKCFYSPPFWYKIGLLVLASAYTLTIRRRVTAAQPDSRRAAPVALASLVLWSGVGFAGRWIAFY